MKQLLISALVFLAAPLVYAGTESPDAAVQAASAQWESTFNSGNLERLAALYTPNAIVVPPSLEIISRRNGIRDYWANQMHSGTSNFAVRTIAVHSEGRLAYQTAVWVATVTSSGKHHEFDGEMTNVLQRQADGSWKIKLQSWN